MTAEFYDDAQWTFLRNHRTLDFSVRVLIWNIVFETQCYGPFHGIWMPYNPFLLDSAHDLLVAHREHKMHTWRLSYALCNSLIVQYKQSQYCTSDNSLPTVFQYLRIRSRLISLLCRS